MESKRHLDLWLLAGATLLGFGLRVINLDLRSITLDESYTLALIKLGLPAVFKSAAQDIHPPLFYILLTGWSRLWGEGLLTARFLTSLFSALLIPVAFFLAKRWLDRKGTWWVVGLVGLSPYFMEVGRVCRSYSLTALLGGLALLFFWKIFTDAKNTFPFLAYVLLTLAAVYTHYFSFLILLSEYVFLAWLYLWKDRQWFQGTGFKKWLAAQAIIALGFLPWFFIFFHQFVKKMTPFSTDRLFKIWDPLLLIYYFIVGSYNWMLLGKITAVAGLAAMGVILANRYFRNRQDFIGVFEKRTWLWLLLVLGVPLLAAILYSLKGCNLVDKRYLHFSALALLILLGGLLSRLPTRAMLASGICIAAIFFFPLRCQWFDYGPAENWRAVAALIEKGKTPDDLLIFHNYCQLPLRYYLKDGNSVMNLPGEVDVVNLKWNHPISVTLSELSERKNLILSHKGVWLVAGDKYEKDKALLVKQWLTDHYGPPQEYFFSHVLVYRFIKAAP